MFYLDSLNMTLLCKSDAIRGIFGIRHSQAIGNECFAAAGFLFTKSEKKDILRNFAQNDSFSIEHPQKISS
jgi:hypothetical protein